MEKFNVMISREAEEDLETIYRYIAEADGTVQAEAIEERLIAAIASLATSPTRGKLPPEMQQLGITDFREIQSPPWRICYTILHSSVGVVAVLDGRRNVAQVLQRRLLQ